MDRKASRMVRLVGRININKWQMGVAGRMARLGGPDLAGGPEVADPCFKGTKLTKKTARHEIARQVSMDSDSFFVLFALVRIIIRELHNSGLKKKTNATSTKKEG